MKIYSGQIISYTDIVLEEGISLQKGMNFNMPSGIPVILMSTRRGAPYRDRVEDEGRTLIYEGHNVPRNYSDSPEEANQELFLPSGRPTENGKFFTAAFSYKDGKSEAIFVTVYEKLRPGLWVFNGHFQLVDAYEENSARRVYKFRLESLVNVRRLESISPAPSLGRMIPSNIKQEVFLRDQGRCVECGESNDLHFDHIVPFSKGGSSSSAKNIQLLCARHNLSKSDKII